MDEYLHLFQLTTEASSFSFLFKGDIKSILIRYETLIQFLLFSGTVSKVNFSQSHSSSAQSNSKQSLSYSLKFV